MAFPEPPSHQCLQCGRSFAEPRDCWLHAWTAHGEPPAAQLSPGDQAEEARRAACRCMPFVEGFLKYAPVPRNAAECQRQLGRLHSSTDYSTTDGADEIMWYVFAVRMFYLTAPACYHSLGRRSTFKYACYHPYRPAMTPNDSHWPWWAHKPELLAQPPKLVGKNALLALVIADAVRCGSVTQEFLGFLDDALSSWWGTSRSRGNREELLLQLFDIDEMTNILIFLLKPFGDDDEMNPYLIQFLATLKDLISRDVLNCALGNVSTLGPFADYFASIGEARETAERLKKYDEMSEEEEIHARQIAPMYNMVALVQHVTMRDVPWRVD